LPKHGQFDIIAMQIFYLIWA